MFGIKTSYQLIRAISKEYREMNEDELRGNNVTRAIFFEEDIRGSIRYGFGIGESPLRTKYSAFGEDVGVAIQLGMIVALFAAGIIGLTYYLNLLK